MVVTRPRAAHVSREMMRPVAVVEGVGPPGPAPRLIRSTTSLSWRTAFWGTTSVVCLNPRRNGQSETMDDDFCSRCG